MKRSLSSRAPAPRRLHNIDAQYANSPNALVLGSSGEGAAASADGGGADAGAGVGGGGASIARAIARGVGRGGVASVSLAANDEDTKEGGRVAVRAKKVARFNTMGAGGGGKSVNKQAEGTPENPFSSDDSAAPWGMRACSNCGQRNLLKGAPHDTCDNPDRRPPADGGIGGGDGGDGGGGGAQPGQILCAGYCEQAFDADEMKPCSSGGCGMSKSKKKKKKSGKGTAGMAGTASTAAMLCSKCYIGAENMLGCKNELGGNNEFGGFSPNKTSSCKTSGLCSACWSVAAMDMHGCGSCSYMEVCVNGVNTTVCDACFKADPWPSTCKGCHSNCPSCEDVVASDDSDGLCYSCYLEAMNE